MKNYDEFNDFRMKDSNEKSKDKKKIAKFNQKKINSKFSQFFKQKEVDEKEKSEINKKMNKFVCGPSAFD